MHTFGITENYFVIVEQPLSISVPTMMQTQFLNEPMGASFKWYEDQQVSITEQRDIKIPVDQIDTFLCFKIPFAVMRVLMFVIITIQIELLFIRIYVCKERSSVKVNLSQKHHAMKAHRKH
jgi:hypothetical protein